MEKELERLLMDAVTRIEPASVNFTDAAKNRWDNAAKPLGGLGLLEEDISRIAGMRRSLHFTLKKRALVVMCADNGIVREGVSQTGSAVTAIVAGQMAGEGTTVTIMAEQAGVDVFPVDIGMDTPGPCIDSPYKPVMKARKILDAKIGHGTSDFAEGPAMSREQAALAMLMGINIAESLASCGYDIICTGEMGIGNTTTSSAVASVLLGKEPETMTGRGAGLSDEGLKRKIMVIKKGIEINSPDADDPLDVLAAVGGFDIAGLAGIFLGGALCRLPVVIDGSISSAAALCAARLCPDCAGYMIASHASAEPASAALLKELGLSPLLSCGMHLGEGTGAVAAIPLLDMALAVYEKAATFEDMDIDKYEHF